MVRWCWVNLTVPGRPTILITVGQGPIALAVGAGRGGLEFLLSSILSPLSPSLWETARYILKYCLKGLLNPKQPTNQPILTLNNEIFPHRFLRNHASYGVIIFALLVHSCCTMGLIISLLLLILPCI